jgi:hypothetical protein
MSDLVRRAAAAGFEIKPRLITDWASIGLLDHAEPRGLGRGKGKSYTWPAEQAGLLLTILQKRETVSRITLLNIPVATWLIWGDQYTPLRQAKRALATWATATVRVGPEKASRSTKAILEQLDHPDATSADRKQLRDLMQQIAFGRDYDHEELVERIRQVMDPNNIGLARGLPVGAEITPEIYAKTIACRLQGAANAQKGDLDDDTWHEARQLYLSHGPVAPFLPELRRPNRSGVLTPAAHYYVEYALNGACQHLVQVLGEIILGLQPKADINP